MHTVNNNKNCIPHFLCARELNALHTKDFKRTDSLPYKKHNRQQTNHTSIKNEPSEEMKN